MKERLHIMVDEKTAKELDKIKNITGASKSVVIDRILTKCMADLKKINYDYSKFIANYIINDGN